MPSADRKPAPGALRPAKSRRWWFRRGVRTPYLPQTHGSECGAVSLGIVLAHFGRRVPLSELRRVCGVSRDGCSAADIVQAAQGYGLEAKGWRREPEQLHRMELPLILFWEFDHFLVLEGVGRDAFYVNDPANGHRRIDAEQFGKLFTGVVLALRPGPDFEPGGRKKPVFAQLWAMLKDQRRLLGLAAAAGLLLVLPGLAVPLLMGRFVDRVLANGEAGGALIAAAVALAALGLLVTRFQQRCLRLAAMRASAARASSFVKHLLRLPLGFFGHRQPGDLTSRVQAIDQVADAASRHLTGMAIELTMSVFMLGFMVWYDPALAALVLALALAGGAATRAVSRLRVNVNHELRREQAQLGAIGMFGLRHADSLRARGAEGHVFSRLTGYQARELDARQRFGEMGSLTSAIPAALVMLSAAAVLGVGGLRVLAGSLTVGELMALYVVAASFLRPVGRFIGFADLFQMLDADLQRLGDVESTGRDAVVEAQSGDTRGVATVGGKLRLAGRLTLEDVRFGFRRNHPPLIDGVSLEIEPGQRIALVGPSGCGKSTLARLVAGAGRHWSGRILYDGQPAEAIPRAVMTDSVAHVDQHIALFAATITENLTMWDSAVPDRQIVQAARDAAIHDQIVTRPLGYHGPVEEGGRNFSGGQRQRLEIARALVNNPSLLILDEATSALDAELEERVHDAIRRRGCACLIVAHRLSAIRDCDEIIVMVGGRITHRGRHDELMAAEDGLYRELVSAE